MALSDEARSYLDAASRAFDRPRHLMSVSEVRTQMDKLRVGPSETPRVDDVFAIPVLGGELAARLVGDTAAPRRIVVYVHGGGWVVNTPMDSFDSAVRVSRALDAHVLLADYRKAPEYRFPTPVDDVLRAIRWAASNRARLGVDQDTPLLVLGESSGANLAAAAAHALRTAREPVIAGQLLVYPVLDARMEHPSFCDPANSLLLTPEMMAWYWDHYAPDLASRLSAIASPLLDEDFADLPPTLVITAEHDVLRDEGEAYCHAVRRAGAPALHYEIAGAMHGFFGNGRFQATREALDDLAAGVELLRV